MKLMNDDTNPWITSRKRKKISRTNVSFISVATAAEIPPGTMKQIQAKSESVMVANISGCYYALESLCPHEGAPLWEGTLYGNVIDCPRHHYTFDLATGENVCPKKSFPPDLA